MPKVGGKHFSYGPKGQAAARRESRKTGKPVQHKSPKSRKGK